jgi:hypothetical protein
VQWLNESRNVFVLSRGSRCALGPTVGRVAGTAERKAQSPLSFGEAVRFEFGDRSPPQESIAKYHHLNYR